MKTKRIKSLLIAAIFAIESIAVGYAPVSAQVVSENTVEESVEAENSASSEAVDETVEVEVETTEVSAEGATIVYSGKDGALDWTIDSNGHLTISGTGNYANRSWDSTNGWLAYREEIKSAEVAVSGITCTEFMFYDCSNLISVDLSKLDTSQVTNMQSMFDDCSSLTSLDVSKFDTSQVTNMESMFDCCSGLTSLDVTKFDTSRVTNMTYMFWGCSGLTSLDVSKFDTSQVTNMSCMFSMCSGLTGLDLSKFDTSRVTDMENMFSVCSNLTSLDVSKFDTSQVTNMSCMFNYCSSLTSLDVSKFDTSQVTDMVEMFDCCSGLRSLDVSNFDTSRVTDMDGMFYRCYSLTSIELPDNITKIYPYAFSDCYALKSIAIYNKSVVIDDTAFDNSDNVVIYGYFGSTAEEFAKEHSIPFVAIDTSDNSSLKTSTESVLGKSYDDLVKSLNQTTFKNYKETLLKNESYIIPGIKRTNVMNVKSCSTMVPQGVCVAKDYLLISAYDSCEGVKEKSSYKHSPKCNSVLYVMDAKTKEYKTTIALNTKCHVGALAYNPDEGVIYIADSTEKVVWKLPYAQIQTQVESNKDAGYISLNEKISTQGYIPSFLAYYQKRIYVGQHVKNEKEEEEKNLLSCMAVYKTDGTLLKKDTLEIPYKSQGVTFVDWTDGKTYMLMSVSLGRGNTSKLHVWRMKRGEDGSLCREREKEIRIITYPNMSEDIEIHGDQLYSCYESAANFYRIGLDKEKKGKSTNVVDRIMIASVGKTIFKSYGSSGGGGSAWSLRNSVPAETASDTPQLTGDAQDCVISGSCGENLLYALYGDGSLNITGSGTMTDYSQEVAPWADYKDLITNLTVGAGVDSIGAGAFADCTSLTTFILSEFSSPDAVFTIGDSAFAGCNSLAKVSLANKEYNIASNAFPLDEKDYVMESDAPTVAAYCEQNGVSCHTHTYVMKETVEPDCGSGGYDLYACECGSEEVRNLVSMNGEHTYELVLDTAPTCAEQGTKGYQCTVCEAYYETYVECLEHTWVKGDSQTSEEDGCIYINYTCSGCGETKVEKTECTHQESTVLYTGSGEKKPTCTAAGVGHTECTKCHAVMSSNISVAAAGHKWNTGVVTKKATAAEKGVKTYTCTVCKSTKTEKIPALGAPKKGTKTSSDDGKATYKVTKSALKNGTVTFVAPKNKKSTSVTVPATVKIKGVIFKVTAIEKNAFKGNKKIKSVTIGKNVKKIGAGAFSGCTKLKTVKFGKNETSIGDKAFYKCTALTQISIPSKVTTIGKSAFYGCKKMTSATIGKSVSKIGSKAFYGCGKLKTLTIKSSKLTTKKIGSKAFSKTPKSMKVTIPKKKFKTYKSMVINKGVNKRAKFKKG
ncbi:MAG: leucine-rich repeat protein [Lachnospiraceae bacterium]|nr:leucine-rich repeat protein [Lachnospiraceae bacterium]